MAKNGGGKAIEFIKLEESINHMTYLLFQKVLYCLRGALSKTAAEPVALTNGADSSQSSKGKDKSQQCLLEGEQEGGRYVYATLPSVRTTFSAGTARAEQSP